MNMKNVLLVSCSMLLVYEANPTAAQSSTETYTYDALGRLIVVKTTGGQNEDEVHSICYDEAGNRVEYTAKSDGATSTCVNDGTGSGGGGTPPPPPSVQITDGSMNVLPAHQSTYDCMSGDIFGSPYAVCSLDADGVTVYSTWANPELDLGYSLGSGGELIVTSSAYGTGTSP